MRSHGKASPAGPTRHFGHFGATFALLLCCVLGIGAPAAIAAPPTPTTKAASEVGITTAKLEGKVDPEGKETSCRFDYLTDALYDENIANSLPGFEGAGAAYCEAALNGTGAQTVALTATGLSPDTAYHARFAISNEEGEAADPVGVEFTTDPIENDPVATVDPATGVTYTKAHISGQIDPEGGNENPGGPIPIGWELQLSTTPGEGFFGVIGGAIEGADAVADDPISEGPPGQPIEANLEGLVPNTAYYYRLVAYYAGKEAVSSEGSFTTDLVTKPVVEVDPASAVTGQTAHLSGEVTAGEVDPAFDSSCFFDFVPDAQYQLGRDEHQLLTIEAEAGTFKLSYEGEETVAIDFDASAGQVQSALEALVAIGPGAVAVSGGPGGPKGESNPYEITFPVTNASQLVVDGADLQAATSAKVKTTTEGAGTAFQDARTVACSTNPATGTDPVEVTADPTGLLPGTTYHLRLRSSNQGGEETDEAPTFQTEAIGPKVANVSASDVTSSGATLRAQVDPGGTETDYHFEYLTLAAYQANGGSFAGATSTPTTSAGADAGFHSVQATLTGLASGTGYRFRVVASNAEGNVTSGPAGFATSGAAESCPNAAVRAQQGSQYLPECRAYEIVNKPTLDLGEANRVPWSSDDGEHLVYGSVIPGDDAVGGGVTSYTVAHRTPGGWVRTNADPFSLGGIAEVTGLTEPRAFSADLSRALYATSLQLAPEDLDNQADFYATEIGSGESTLMSPAEDFLSTVVMGATPNLDQIVYLRAGGASPPGGIYRSDRSGSLELLSLYPDNVTPVPPGRAQPAGGGRASRGLGVEESPIAPFAERGGGHAVSDDTNRTYFYDQSAHVALYVRDLLSAPARTVAVSISERGADAGKSEGERIADGGFISASHDGSQAYFASPAQLTDAGTPGGGIYKFDLEAPAGERLTQITPDAGDASGLHLSGAIASDDQSHIYFTSTSALAPGAEPGTNNAYAWTEAGGVRFIAAVGGEVDFGDRFSRVTPDGRFALLSSSTSIEGAAANGHRQIFRYDYATDEIACVSCRADGSPSQGDASLQEQSYGQPAGPLSRSRALTFDGRVVFMSTDRLVDADQTAAQDVYIYAGGRPSLLSSGKEETASYIGDTSDDGTNITIVTRSALVGADRDAAEYDVYDVRAGGGFLEPPPPPAPCEGEACRGATSSPPAAAGPPTRSFSGPGNPKPCKKGKVRRNGRCVKAKHKRHHKKKHHKQNKNKAQQRDAGATGRTGR